jgi:hypothetical protein
VHLGVQGYKLAVVPMDDEHPDAVPELTRALRPDLHYSYLVARPHAWRKQLAFKGRRLTVGQFLGRMHADLQQKKITNWEKAVKLKMPVGRRPIRRRGADERSSREKGPKIGRMVLGRQNLSHKANHQERR